MCQRNFKDVYVVFKYSYYNNLIVNKINYFNAKVFESFKKTKLSLKCKTNFINIYLIEIYFQYHIY